MKEHVKNNLKNWSVNGSLVLTTALYSSMSFTYRLDKDLEMSSLNYSFMADTFIDVLSDKKINYAYKSENDYYNHETFSSNTDEQVSFYNVLNNAVLNRVRVVKKGGCSSLYNSGVRGFNAGILSEYDITVCSSYIQTYGEGAKGFYQKGTGSHAKLSKVVVETLQDNSNAIEVADHAMLSIRDSIIYTNGEKSGGLCVSANSRLNADNLTILVSNDNSPALYANGQMVIKNSLIETAGSYIAVIEGDTSFVSLNNSLRGHNGIKLMNKSQEENIKCRAMITGRYMNVDSGCAFYIDNISANISLLNTNLFIKDERFITVISGEKRNRSEFVLANIFASGLIRTDENSDLILRINNGVKLNSVFNGNICLDFNKTVSSSVNLAGDSRIDQIKLSVNNMVELKKYINLNGFKLIYNKKNNEWLQGKNYYFEDGSSLIAI